MIGRRRVLTVIAGIACALPGLAQSTGPLRHVGVLEVVPEAMTTSGRAALLRALLGMGWVEGRDVRLTFLSAQGQEQRLDALAAQLVNAGAEVIATSSAVSTRALQRATRSVPIVMVFVVDPVGNGFVASLAHPGGNITGLSNQQQDLFAKQAELVAELVPGLRRMAFVLNANNPSHAAYREAARRAGTALGLSATVVSLSLGTQLDSLVQEVDRVRPQAVVVPADPLFTSLSGELVQRLATLRVPTVYGRRIHVAHGGLLSYGSDLDANWRHAARFIDRLLRGARPADLPVEQPTRFELVVNLKTAKALGIKIPQSVLLRADEVIE
jgi:putative ABC transport system substrate-binding protein